MLVADKKKLQMQRMCTCQRLQFTDNFIASVISFVYQGSRVKGSVGEEEERVLMMNASFVVFPVAEEAFGDIWGWV